MGACSAVNTVFDQPACRSDITTTLDNKKPIQSESPGKSEIICNVSSTQPKSDYSSPGESQGILQLIKDGSTHYFPIRFSSTSYSSSQCGEQGKTRYKHPFFFDYQPEREVSYQIGPITTNPQQEGSFVIAPEELKILLENGHTCNETNTQLSIVLFGQSTLALAGSYKELGKKPKDSHLVHVRFNNTGPSSPLWGLNYYVSRADYAILLRKGSRQPSETIFLQRGVANYSIPSNELRCTKVKVK